MPICAICSQFFANPGYDSIYCDICYTDIISQEYSDGDEDYESGDIHVYTSDELAAIGHLPILDTNSNKSVD